MNGILAMVTNEGRIIVVQTEILALLLNQAQGLVAAGRFHSLDELIEEALRRFLESHQDKIVEGFIRQDVEWGLRGDE